MTVLKISDDEIPGGEGASEHRAEVLVPKMEALVAQGADSVVVSRGAEGVLALLKGHLVTARSPRLGAVDELGAGDSLTAGMSAALAEGSDLESALRIGVAAGALNVTRRGLGSGNRRDIEELADRVEIVPCHR